MKRKSLLLMTLLALFASGAWAQTATNRDDDYYGYVEIGDGTLGMVDAPLRGFYKSSYDQMIYTASQINKSGTITKIGFNAKETETYTLARKPKIYMGHTSKSSFDSDTDFVSINDLTLVYDYSASGNSTWNITAGWNAFVLDTPFDYNGEDNLVIAMHCEMIDAYESTSFYYTGTTFHQVVYACSDTDDPIPATYDNNWDSYGGLKGKTTELPNVRLYFDEPIIETCFDFESGSMPSGWASEGAGTWRVTRWADYFGSILPHGGQYNAVRYSEGNETYLVMPSQDFSNTSSATLNFWYVNRDYQDPWLGYQKSDILAVCYRIGSDGTWNTLWSTKDVHNSWAEQSINLTGLAADYQIGFKYTKRGGKGVGLDDICYVSDDPSQINVVDNRA